MAWGEEFKDGPYFYTNTKGKRVPYMYTNSVGKKFEVWMLLGAIDENNEKTYREAYLDRGILNDTTFRELMLISEQYRETVPKIAEDATGKAEFVRRVDMELVRKRAEKLERAFRLEEAARLYEAYDMIDEAGRVRRARGTTKVIQVDFNNLIERIRSEGIVANYKCPNCGAGIQIKGDTEVEGLKFCGHCGNKIETMSLAEFLGKLLG